MTAEEDEENRRRGWLDWLMPRIGGIGDIFNLLFMGLILAVGGYFLMQIPAVRDWVQENLPDIAAGLNDLTGGRLFPDAVDQYIGNLTADQAREQLPRRGVPQEVANIVAENQNTWDDFRRIVREANGGRIRTAEDFTSPNTIYQLMLQRPALVRRIVGAVMPQPGQAPSQANAATLQAFITSVRTILNDPNMMRELLNDQHRADTLALLRAACPIQFEPPSAFDRFVETVGIQNGQLTPAFKTFAEAVLATAGQDAATAETTARTAFLNLLLSPGMENRAAEIAALMSSARQTGPDGQTVRPPLFELLSNEQNVGATIALVRQLEQQSPGRATAVLTALGQNQDFFTTLQQYPGALEALQQWARTVDEAALPADMRQTVLALRNLDSRVAAAVEGMSPQAARTVDQVVLPVVEAFRLMSPEPAANRRMAVTDIPVQQRTGQAELPAATLDRLSVQDRLFLMLTRPTVHEFLARDNNLGRLASALPEMLRASGIPDADAIAAFLTQQSRGGDGQMHYVNLEAIISFTATVMQNPNNQTAERQNVIYAIYRMVQGDMSVFNSLNPRQIAAFFGDEANLAAMDQLIRGLDPSALPAPYRRVIETLQAHWYNEIPRDNNWSGVFRYEGLRPILKYPGVIAAIQGREWGFDDDWFPFDDLFQSYAQTEAFPGLTELGSAVAEADAYARTQGRMPVRDADPAEAVAPVGAPAATDASLGVRSPVQTA